jgi:hypothetical protein
MFLQQDMAGVDYNNCNTTVKRGTVLYVSTYYYINIKLRSIHKLKDVGMDV